MRVAGGKLRGREFSAPKGYATHPMSERIRNALFNALGDISGLTIFDAYGGSGALAIEAVSRGASSVAVTEKNPKAARVIEKNINNLGLKKTVTVSRANCISWLKTHNKKFDVILADPPFGGLQEQHLLYFVRHLTASGIMVLSHVGRTDVPQVDGVVVVKHRNYGTAALTFYRLAE